MGVCEISDGAEVKQTIGYNNNLGIQNQFVVVLLVLVALVNSANRALALYF